ncbi:MAG: LytTR family DNA-binding domain-containing protein [Tateyamaria sp.]
MSQRILFWALHVFPALILLQVSQSLLTRVPGYGRGTMWVWVALSALLGAALFTPWAFLIDAWFELDAQADDGDPESVWREFVNIAPSLIVVWIALNAGRVLRLHAPTGPVSAPAPQQAPAFWAKVPATLGRDLVALSAELHYTRVRTALGSDLILYPFGVALSDVRDEDGMQVHRSHWVALSHVTEVTRTGQRAVCALSDGSSVPVSRTYRSEFEERLAHAGSFRA